MSNYYGLPLIKGGQARPLDSAHVNEHVFAAGCGLNEAEALGAVKLHDTFNFPWLSICARRLPRAEDRDVGRSSEGRECGGPSRSARSQRSVK
jgi:hypothetical protein